MVITRRFERGTGLFGILLGAALLIAVGSGYLRLNIHGYMLVVFGTAIWQVLVANTLWRS